MGTRSSMWYRQDSMKPPFLADACALKNLCLQHSPSHLFCGLVIRSKKKICTLFCTPTNTGREGSLLSLWVCRHTATATAMSVPSFCQEVTLDLVVQCRSPASGSTPERNPNAVLPSGSNHFPSWSQQPPWRCLPYTVVGAPCYTSNSSIGWPFWSCTSCTTKSCLPKGSTPTRPSP